MRQQGNKSFHISKLLPWHGAIPGLTDIPSPSSTNTTTHNSQQQQNPLHFPMSQPHQQLDNNGQPIPSTHHTRFLPTPNTSSTSPPVIINTYSQDTQEPQHGSQFYAKQSKCSFAQPEITFCGYIVGLHGVCTITDKLQLIHDWLTPTSSQDIRRFLGLTGFYQNFIPNYAQNAASMTRLLRKTTTFEWTHEQETSFNTLKT